MKNHIISALLAIATLICIGCTDKEYHKCDWTVGRFGGMVDTVEFYSGTCKCGYHATITEQAGYINTGDIVTEAHYIEK